MMLSIRIFIILLSGYIGQLFFMACEKATDREEQPDDKRFNILIAVSDDQSYPHAGIYGEKTVHTPTFDRLASEGILFHNAFAASPGCAPSRSAIHTGRFPWQNEEAGGHQTLFPLKYVTYPDVLEEAGYFIGYTGKGVSPFNLEASGRTRNPAGPAWNDIAYEGEEREQLPTNMLAWYYNYAANFEAFLSEKPEDQPFYFWYGGREAHRPYEEGSGLRSGKQLEDVTVPGFFPDHEIIRNDMLDYALEIDWFDRHLTKMITLLEEKGELENTLVIITSDQGMPFPRAKTNLYDYSLRVPLAIYWPGKIQGGREVHDLVSLADITPTLLELTGVPAESMMPITARSLTDILFSDRSGIIDPSRDAVYAGRERHSSARWANLGYPQRSVRTHDYLYIRNFAPERWPAGAPQILRPDRPSERHYMHGLDANGRFTGEAYFDIDDSPTKAFLIENMDDPDISFFYELSMGKRPAEELYDVRKDPYNIHNLAADPGYSEALRAMRQKLSDFLRETGDPRVVGPVPDVFENYQRFAGLRAFPKPDWIKEEYRE